MRIRSALHEQDSADVLAAQSQHRCLRSIYLLYLLYRHKTTHAHAKCAANTHRARADMERLQVLNLLALLGQRYTY
jgi:hypothetical protein